MREIKFRAWDKNSKTMIYQDKDYDIISGLKVLFEELANPARSFKLMQFTGLHDKNGKEIYQKDILGGIWETLFINYCEKCKQNQIFNYDFGCMSCIGDVQWIEVVEDEKELEVIGNIYENPDLLTN